eukprot:6355522-Prymnesium_polylepis.2
MGRAAAVASALILARHACLQAKSLAARRPSDGRRRRPVARHQETSGAGGESGVSSVTGYGRVPCVLERPMTTRSVDRTTVRRERGVQHIQWRRRKTGDEHEHGIPGVARCWGPFCSRNL